MIRTLVSFALLLAAASVAAQPAAWTLRRDGSRIDFVATFEGAPAPGTFGTFDVALQLDPDGGDGGRLDVTVDLRSARTGSDDVDRAIRGPEWLDVARFPTAEFHATELRRRGANALVARGTLTLKGVAKPVDVPVALAIAGDEATLSGTVVLDRLAFGVGSGEWRSTRQIAGDVKVDFSVRLARRR